MTTPITVFSCHFDAMTLETYGQHLGLSDERIDECAGCWEDVTDLAGHECYCGAVVCSEACFDSHICGEEE